MHTIGRKFSVAEIQHTLKEFNAEELGQIITFAMSLKKEKHEKIVGGTTIAKSSAKEAPYFGQRTDYGNRTISLVMKGQPDHASYVHTVNVRIRVKSPFSTIFQAYQKRTKVTEGSLSFFGPEGILITAQDTPETLGLEEGDVIDVKFANLH